MSQQTAPIWSIIEKILAEAGDMGDTEYMAKKAFDGKIVTVTGAIDTLNDTIEYIVPNGKRFYFHSAKIVITGHTNPPDMNANTQTTTSDRVQAALKIDGVAKDTTNIGIVSSMAGDGAAGGEPSGGAGYGNIGDGKFDVKGLSLVGDGAKKIEIENVLSGGTADATLIGFEEDTLTDPTLLAQSISVEATVDGDTGDLAFITERVQSGNYFQVSGDINALNDTIEFIVPNLKTAFLIEAKITMSTNPDASGRGTGGTDATKDQVVADLLIDTVKKSKAKIGIATRGAGSTGSASQAGAGASGSGFGGGQTCPFNVLGLSLVGDGAKKIEIENVLDSGFAFAEMSGYLIDT